MNVEQNWRKNFSHPECSVFTFDDDGTFPNNGRCPLIVYHGVFAGDGAIEPEVVEKCFAANDWTGSWRNGLFSYHHYHSTAHEVLGIYCGWVEALLGGPKGQTVRAAAGDVLVIPAGVAHKNIDQSADFRVIGAYPGGQFPDMNYGREEERPAVDRSIEQVAMPGMDPVCGEDGPLFEAWQR